MTNERYVYTEVVCVLLVISPGALEAELRDRLSGLHPPPSDKVTFRLCGDLQECGLL